MDTNWLLAQLVVSSALAGLCWTVQLAVYPVFSRVFLGAGSEGFRGYHAEYTRAMGRVAGPLMLVELGLAAAWVVAHPRLLAAQFGAALVVALWGLTFGFFVPAHARLQKDPGLEAIGRLVHWNRLRTALWTARAVLLFVVA